MSESLREELSRWGFSDSEVEVYLAALEAGEAPASEVADRADVSTRHVYRISERLEEVGLVDVYDQYQPTLIRPASSDEVADIMQDRQETIVSEIDRHRGEARERGGDLELLKRKVTVLGRCRSMLSEAEEVVLLVAPADLLASLADDLLDALDRGVLVQLFTEDVSQVAGHSLDDLATVARVHDTFGLFHQFGLAVDYYRTLIVVAEAVDLPVDEQFAPALYLDEKEVTWRINASFLEYEWKLGEERVVPDPAPLPAEFDVNTAATMHAALHLDEGTDLYARAAGYEVEADGTKGAPTTVEGEVLEVRQGAVEPGRKTFLVEQVMVLDTDDGEVVVAGPGGKTEDVAAHRIELEEVDGSES